MLPLITLAQSNSLAELRQSFNSPPDDCRIVMRWWWFGPAVEKTELARELEVMKAAGIGGVEIQPVYPLVLNDGDQVAKNSAYLSTDFLQSLRFVAERAKALGLRLDITLGSGWPFGGPATPITQAAGRLRVEQIEVPEGTRSVTLPAMEQGETLIAAFIGGQQTTAVRDGRIIIPPGLSGKDVLQVFISSRTGQQVKRAALGAEGFVLDHYQDTAILSHLANVADRLLQAMGPNKPHSVFSDSLEVYQSDWSPNFLQEFRRRRGYDLTPHLPELANDQGQTTGDLRHDWGKTLTELAEDNYLKPIRDWAHSHGTLFRSQTYGEPPVILSSNALVDLPEGEHGPVWRRFSAARWASSASHLYGRPVTSTETWTWLHSPAFRATPLDLKAEADRHFVQGINQLIGHGWPYSPPSAGEPGWRFYAAAALNDHNPWFSAMPDMAKYFQRVSFLLRQGKPANDVAVYLPTDDAWAHLQLGKTAVDEMADTLLGPVLVPAILNSGYNFDFIDDRSMEAAGIPYKILLLPGLERMPLQTLERIQKYVQGGGIAVATRSLPQRGPGLLENSRDSSRISELAHQLFQSGLPNATFVPDEQHLSAVLPTLLTPDFATGSASPFIGFVHRTLPFAEVYFVANLSNQPIQTQASVRGAGKRAQWWSALNGDTGPATVHPDDAKVTSVPLALAPYESRVLVFGDFASPASAPASELAATKVIDLDSNWRIEFTSTGRSGPMQPLHSWTDDEGTRYYSGTVIYQNSFDVTASELRSRHHILDFGPGTTTESETKANPGMRALLESPVREAAVIFVNNQRAGAVWCPPYELDISRYLHTGSNHLKIIVGNLAINEMAGEALPDYRFLNLRYGERFTPQDMHDLNPLPSGILKGVKMRLQ